MLRRSFLSYFLAMLGSASAQQAIMEGKKAVVCDDSPVKCPLGLCLPNMESR